jgi:hypothetical protein
MLRDMRQRDLQALDVDGIEVLLVRDGSGVRWECSVCCKECEHELKAAAWITLQSWSVGKMAH